MNAAPSELGRLPASGPSGRNADENNSTRLCLLPPALAVDVGKPMSKPKSNAHSTEAMDASASAKDALLGEGSGDDSLDDTSDASDASRCIPVRLLGGVVGSIDDIESAAKGVVIESAYMRGFLNYGNIRCEARKAHKTW